MRGNRTVILIAHSLSTMVDADRIYVLHDGGIVETGTYKELYHHGGVFAELARGTDVGDLELSQPTASVIAPVAVA